MRRGAHALLGAGALLVLGATTRAVAQHAGPHAPSQPPPTACSVCGSYGPARETGHLGDPALREASGLAASRVHAGLYYSHNDSGDTARFFAIDATGARRGEFALAGARVVDVEDVAVGPCAASRACVVLGDIGDNRARRGSVALYVLPEPALPADARAPVTVQAERVEFAYPDGPHDAEALAVDPATGVAYVLTKELGHTRVFRLDPPLRAGPARTPRLIADVPIRGGLLPLVTAADAHPCAPRLLLRTYTGALEFRAPAGQPLEAAFAQSPAVVPAAREFQSEAIAYRADGAGYLTVPEGAGSALHEVRCAGQ